MSLAAILKDGRVHTAPFAMPPDSPDWWWDGVREVYALGQYPILRESWSGQLIEDLAKHPGSGLPDFARKLRKLREKP